jgi:GTP-binding protein
LKVFAADFVTSVAADGTGIPTDGLPQVALAGRSNVGKSSLINALARRTIARTSAAPGKTRLANIYRIEVEGARGPGRTGLYLVDLPGYGYARGGADSAAELKAVAEAYLRGRDSGPATRDPRTVHPESFEPRASSPGSRRRVLLLVDSRHPGLESDIAAAGWLGSMRVVTHIVATKIDKLTRSERARNLKTIGETFGTAALPVSAASGEGLDELWRMIASIGKDADRHE